MGDVVICSFLFEAIKKEKHAGRIVAVCSQQKQVEILRFNPYVDRIILLRHRWQIKVFESLCRRMRWSLQSVNFYDAPLDISMRNAKELVGEMFEIDSRKYRMQVYPDDKEVAWAKKFRAPYKYVILMQVHSRASRNHFWLRSRWEEVVRTRPQYTFVQIGLPDEERIAGAIDLRGSISIQRSLALAAVADSLVAVDGSLAHIGHAVGLRGVVLFGDSSPVHIGHDSHINIHKRLDCSPCFSISEGQAPCPYGHACMLQISTEEVIAALDHQLALGRQDAAEDRSWRVPLPTTSSRPAASTVSPNPYAIRP